MYLKKLELSGFKSFAKTIVFEFLTPITAIVGPNGSGKSNVAESIRWVLGEQSLKSLRGKRGEDFIFSGTLSAPRLGRASSTLFFDNEKKHFPVEFDEVILSRRVTRDGVNQYLLNGSPIRLKDINQLLSKVGLGSTQHHIISQGEADRVLAVSLEERRDMIEDALGLKGYQLQRTEAERKLTHTEENIKQVSALRKEVAPHLSYLKGQAEKMKGLETLARELKDAYTAYMGSEELTIQKEYQDIEESLTPFIKSRERLEKEIQIMERDIVEAEKGEGDESSTPDISPNLQRLEQEKNNLLRSLGHAEGKLEEMRGEEKGMQAVVPFTVVAKALRSLGRLVDEVMSGGTFEALKSGIQEIRNKIEEVFRNLGTPLEGRLDVESLLKKRDYTAKELEKKEADLSLLLKEYRKQEDRRGTRFQELREKEKALRFRERDLEEIRANIKNFDFDKEKLNLRRRELEDMRGGLENGLKSITGVKPFSNMEERDRAKKKFERLKIKMEESGAIDASILKEYEDISKRDEFLDSQLNDVIEAAKSLRTLITDLTKKLDRDFREGISKINAEFKKFFSEMFNGGSGELKIIEPKKKQSTEGEEETGNEAGIEIAVDLPRKRIHSLDMLSGGERALASIALLFAMSAVNPPPFLVLDETDAALDEANSQRYAKLLKSLSKKTQLILITHNRETMKSAGVLYGVTMGNDGISRLLSLKLEEAEEIAQQ